MADDQLTIDTMLQTAKQEFGDEIFQDADLEADVQPEIEDPGEQDAETEDQYSEDVLAIAAEWGWKPKGEFKGEQDKYVDPKTFIQRERDNRRNAQELNKELKRELQSIRQSVNKLSEARQQEELAEQQSEVDKIKDQIRDATEEGDTDLVFDLQEKLFELRQKNEAKPLDPQYEPNPADPLQEETQSAVDAFKQLNADWFEKDERLTEMAIALDNQYAREGRNAAESLRLVQEKMKPFIDAFMGATTAEPDTDPEPRRIPRTQAVENPTRVSTGSRNQAVKFSSEDIDFARQAVRAGIFDTVEEALGIKKKK
jgi:hypothetical protein